MNTRRNYVGVNLTPEQQDKLFQLMKATNQTQSNVIRQLIDLADVVPAIGVRALPAAGNNNGAALVSDPAGAVVGSPRRQV